MRAPKTLSAVGLLLLAPACKKGGAVDAAGTAGPSATSAADRDGAAPTTEVPRCKPEGHELSIPADDALVGEGIFANDALYVGLTRTIQGQRVGSVLRVSPALDTHAFVDLGPQSDAAPVPVPFVAQGSVHVAYVVPASTSKGSPARPGATAVPKAPPRASALHGLQEMRVERIDSALAHSAEGTVLQRVDESAAFDIAWPEDPHEPGLVAWDEDAPLRPGRTFADRGVVLAERLRPGAVPVVVSPETTDAEGPRLVRREKGYWIGWLAKKVEDIDAGTGTAKEAQASIETSGEARVMRWVEVAALDEEGRLASPVVAVSSPRGHATSFELVAPKLGGPLVVLVADETEELEEGGGKLVRFAVTGREVSPPSVIAKGISSAPFSLVETQVATHPWLAFADKADRAHGLHVDLLNPAAAVVDAGTAGQASRAIGTEEPAFDGARVLASFARGGFFAVRDARAAGTAPSDPGRAPTLVRVLCP